MASVKCHANDFFNLSFDLFLKFSFEENACVNTAFSFQPKHLEFLVCNKIDSVLRLRRVRYVAYCSEGCFFLRNAYLV